MLASQLLGPLPSRFRHPGRQRSSTTHAVRPQLDAFSNFTETVANDFPFAGPVPSDA